MKKLPTIVAFRGRQEPSPLEEVLDRWDYPVRVCRRSDRLAGILAGDPPDLLILERRHLEEDKVLERLGTGSLAGISRDCSLIVLGDEKGQPAAEPPLQPCDLLRLHQALQRNLGSNRRRHLRIGLKLPGIFLLEGASLSTSILSLGTGGVFVRTGAARLGRREEVSLVIPLLGMKREIEVKVRVIYEVSPRLENNYLEGAGLQFVDLDAETRQLLRDYILRTLLSGNPAQGATPGSPGAGGSGLRAPRREGRQTGFRVTYGL